MNWPQVLLPESLDELLELRERHGNEMTLLAGGTALMNRIRTGEDAPAGLLSMGRLSELREIEAGGGLLRLGALVTHRRLERSAAARQALPLLTSAVSLVANRRVRNVGTLGGNVSDADYGYDPPGVLHALGARVTLRSKRVTRTLTLDEFLLGYHRTTLADDEVMTGIEVPLPAENADWVYLKHLTRSLEDRPALSVCAVAQRDADGRCLDLRVSVRAARPVPLRVAAAEAMARGNSLADGALVAEIAEAYAQASDPIDDMRASAAYRKRLVPVLVRRALEDIENGRRRAVKVWSVQHVPRKVDSGGVIGRPVPMVDADARVTGKIEYVLNMDVPGMCHAAVHRSERPHALIRSIDYSAAMRVAGVVGVLTREDFAPHTDINPYYGSVIRDQPVVAIDKVRYVGEPVAVVAALTERAAREAAALITVEYEDLDPVYDVEEALREAAPLLHDRDEMPAGSFVTVIPVRSHGGNVCNRFALRHGDVERGLAEADHVFQDAFTSPAVAHVPMEPHVALAWTEGDRLLVWSSTQTPYAVQHELAGLFDLPHAKVQVKVPSLGGGYGAKVYAKIEPIVAALTRKIGRPVKLTLSRAEDMICLTKHAVRITLTTGVMADGRLVARRVRALYNAGAYADISPRLITNGGAATPGPYRTPNVEVESYAVYTNLPPAPQPEPVLLDRGDPGLREPGLRRGRQPGRSLRQRRLRRPQHDRRAGRHAPGRAGRGRGHRPRGARPGAAAARAVASDAVRRSP